ncbi:MAG: hydrogenase, partial [bacterium]
LHRDFLPANWGYYRPTMYEIGILIGSFGFFLTFFLIFCRVLPTIAMFELKAVMKFKGKEEGDLYA